MTPHDSQESGLGVHTGPTLPVLQEPHESGQNEAPMSPPNESSESGWQGRVKPQVQSNGLIDLGPKAQLLHWVDGQH